MYSEIDIKQLYVIAYKNEIKFSDSISKEKLYRRLKLSFISMELEKELIDSKITMKILKDKWETQVDHIPVIRKIEPLGDRSLDLNYYFYLFGVQCYNIYNNINDLMRMTKTKSKIQRNLSLYELFHYVYLYFGNYDLMYILEKEQLYEYIDCAIQNRVFKITSSLEYYCIQEESERGDNLFSVLPIELIFKIDDYLGGYLSKINFRNSSKYLKSILPKYNVSIIPKEYDFKYRFGKLGIVPYYIASIIDLPITPTETQFVVVREKIYYYALMKYMFSNGLDEENVMNVVINPMGENEILKKECKAFLRFFGYMNNEKDPFYHYIKDFSKYQKLVDCYQSLNNLSKIGMKTKDYEMIYYTRDCFLYLNKKIDWLLDM